MTTGHDRELLTQAYHEAMKASGNSDPNPSVGAIITNPAGGILARGYTQRAGYAHAERHALAQIPDADLRGCTMHVTLEPCCHHGRTPPCVDAIVERQLAKVVISQRDFAAEVQGRSVDLLQRAGIEVVETNPADFRLEKWLTTGSFFFARAHNRPRVLLKWAQTADGFLAPQKGPSGAISGTLAAAATALFRFASKLTLASPGTVLADNPRLNVRLPAEIPAGFFGKFSDTMRHFLKTQADLIRSVESGQFASTALRLPERYLLLPQTSSKQTAGELTPQQAGMPLTHTMFVPHANWQANFAAMIAAALREISSLGYNSLLIEAGPVFSQKLIDHDLVDGLLVYRSREKTSAQLWGMPGRANSLSSRLVESDSLVGFQVLEKVTFEEDDLVLLAADRAL